MRAFLERAFRLSENGTTVRREILGGATTFMTMSYIIFVQPAVLGAAGMDKGAVMTATCLASALATLLTGLLARYPIAQAPAMGHNVFFAVVVCGTMGYTWQVALGANFLSGLIFLALALLGVWGKVVAAVPDGLKYGISVGIGLLIAMVGLEYGGLVVARPGVLVGLGDLGSPPVLLALFGLALTAVLMAVRFPGAILAGILATALAGIPFGIVEFHGLTAPVPSLAPTFLRLDIAGALRTGLVSVVFVFFLLDVFDAIGTLIGVGGAGGFLKDGRLPRADKAMLADAAGTVGGVLLGTSTVSSYIESVTGIAQGARTGLANIVTSALFLCALFFSPLAQMISGEVVSGGMVLRPVIAPALIVVGSLMMKCVRFIDWDDPTEALPAFLSIIVMPLTMSITEGISFGLIAYVLLKVAAGQGRRIHWLLHVFAALFVLRYVLK
ncbi:MAG TPA: NCS2 family permease [Candidatus Aminicenantes bacterium]|nr:NCS2 family permease [Candidatus Aminicenantes bacterium]HRY66226.1 NCS2 family permease [Candidatus Aminicenantes bacterium]HRZ73140.1 NCS2 family permease [Candidatus Aminicenantes bacterium]